MIMLGPLFCFQSAQPFFTSYIPYVLIVFLLSVLYDLLLSLNLVKSSVG